MSPQKWLASRDGNDIGIENVNGEGREYLDQE